MREKSETDVHYSSLFGFQKSDDVTYTEMEICGTPLVAPGKKVQSLQILSIVDLAHKMTNFLSQGYNQIKGLFFRDIHGYLV